MPQSQDREDMAAGSGLMLTAANARYDVQAVLAAIRGGINGNIFVQMEQHQLFLHEGDEWSYSEINELGSAATRDLIITTCAVCLTHLLYDLSGAQKGFFQLFENTTHGLGATLTLYNNLRSASGAAPMSLNVSAGGGADGTEISTAYLGDKKVGVQIEEQWILNANAKYLLRITSGAAASLFTTVLHFWEEP